MLQNKLSLIIAAALVVAGCGGSGSNPAPVRQFTSQVVFGDSLSDVGTYAVGAVAASGGGLYTVNKTLANGSLAPQNWTELVAPSLNLPQPCPAITGLDGNPAFGLFVPVTFHPGCTSYAMGGAMVTSPFGPGNKNLPSFLDGSTDLGQLTVPVVTQIQNHLAANGGAFSGTEIVFLLAGGNDAIVNTLTYVASVEEALALGGPAAAAAEAAIAGPAAVQAMGLAGTQLAGYINNLIVAKGANFVTLLTLPDLSAAPFTTQINAQLPGTQALVSQMVQTFNSVLLANVSPNVLVVDLYAASVEQFANPAAFGLTNTTDTACALTVPPAPPNPAVNFLNSSLVCSSNTNAPDSAPNVIPGNITNYAFADTVHPTPYGYYLIANLVAANLGAANWLSN